MKLFIGYKAWKNEEYLLNRMTFGDLIRAYVTYPGIQVYAALIIVTIVAGTILTSSPLRFGAALLVGGLFFPIAWYIAHRWVLHGAWMYKFPIFASLWKRVHYDHHRFPNDLSVLFGGLHTTLPSILLLSGPLGFLIDGWAGACGAIAGTLVMTCYTEFLHAGQHLAFEPKSAFWRTIKKRHLAHHFHNESGNFGIAEFFWDRVFGTFYAEAADRPRSATARNLGYDAEMAAKYPWVKQLTDKEPAARQSMRARGGAEASS
ncbi:MAG: sterol desaturase family protein [Parvularculaceae bacterium]|nr:sterol desaturase family protein [Parvularculaceae bacterium]